MAITYIDNFGIAVDGIKLHKKGVWLVSTQNELNPELYVANMRSTSSSVDGSLCTIRAKTPPMSGYAPNQVPTIQWVLNALTNASLPTINLEGSLEQIQINKNNISALTTSLNDLTEEVEDLRSDVESRDIVSQKVILNGGNLAGWN